MQTLIFRHAARFGRLPALLLALLPAGCAPAPGELPAAPPSSTAPAPPAAPTVDSTPAPAPRAAPETTRTPRAPRLVEQLTGKVVSVTDGDTVRVLVDGKEMRVRLHGIDCPERRQPFSERATRLAGDLAFGNEVRVEVKDIDRYGRTVGEVFVEGKSVNAALVEAGLAWAYVQYSKEYVALEEAARREKRGLWSEKNPTPPWEYRARGRRNNRTNQRSSLPLDRVRWLIAAETLLAGPPGVRRVSGGIRFTRPPAAAGVHPERG